MPDDLRARIAKALKERTPSDIPWKNILTFDTLQECRDRYFGEADAVLAVLAEDPGNLPKRMAEAIVSHEWTDFPRSAHNQHNYYAECAVCQRDVPRITEAALSVRDELVAHLTARAAKAEARVGHAEAGAQLSSERLAKVQQELDRLWSPAPDSAGRHAAHCEWGAASGAYCSCVGLAEIARLRAERDALKTAVQHLAAEAHRRKRAWEDTSPGAFEELHRLGNEMLAALNVENTTTPARETV